MEVFGTFLVMVVVGAVIGGMTNYLAIKMLFFPRKPLFFVGRKVPFTPGLIPKRRDEIASALGRIVAEHLVTAEGIASAFRRTDLKEMAEEKIKGIIRDWSTREQTVEELVLHWLTPEQWALVRLRIAGLVRTGMLAALGNAIRSPEGLLARKIKDLIPHWEEKNKEWLARSLGDFVLSELRSALLAESGKRLVGRLVERMTERAGGFLGALAAALIDKDKWTERLRVMIAEQMDSPMVRHSFRDVLRVRLTALEERSLKDLLDEVLEEDSQQRLERWVKHLPVETWVGDFASIRLDEIVAPLEEALNRQIPVWVEKLINFFEAHAEKAMETLRLSQLVENQVRRFPVEQVERIVLSFSGKEFRAITWLGALLGGVIGAVQWVLFYFL